MSVRRARDENGGEFTRQAFQDPATGQWYIPSDPTNNVSPEYLNEIFRTTGLDLRPREINGVMAQPYDDFIRFEKQYTAHPASEGKGILNAAPGLGVMSAAFAPALAAGLGGGLAGAAGAGAIYGGGYQAGTGGSVSDVLRGAVLGGATGAAAYGAGQYLPNVKLPADNMLAMAANGSADPIEFGYRLSAQTGVDGWDAAAQAAGYKDFQSAVQAVNPAWATQIAGANGVEREFSDADYVNRNIANNPDLYPGGSAPGSTVFNPNGAAEFFPTATGGAGEGAGTKPDNESSGGKGGGNPLTDIGKSLAVGAASTLVANALSGGGNSTYDPTADLAAAEDARQAAKRKGAKDVNDVFGTFNDDYYARMAQAYRDYQNPLHDENYQEAARKLPLSFARTDNSAFNRTRGFMERDYLRGQTDINKQAEDFANQKRGEVENNRSALLSQVESGAGLDSIAQQAASIAKAQTRPPAFSPIGDMFSKYTSNMANATLAADRGYKPNNVLRPLTFNRGNSGSGSYSINA